jgi:hypothetical protein
LKKDALHRSKSIQAEKVVGEILWLSLNSSGLSDVVVDVAEVQFAGDLDDDGIDGGEAAEAAGATLGDLEQAVDGLQKAVGLSCRSPGDNDLELAAHHRCDLFHGVDLRAHHAACPHNEDSSI